MLYFRHTGFEILWDFLIDVIIYKKNVCFVTMLFLIEPMSAQVQESIKEHFEKLDIAISLVEQSLKKEDTISICPSSLIWEKQASVHRAESGAGAPNPCTTGF